MQARHKVGKLPTFSVPNLGVYYALGFFLNGWFILPNWFFFYRQHLTVVEIGVVEGIAILTGIILEVPSGALADTIGKKKTLILGSILVAISCIIQSSASKLIAFIIGEMVMFAGFALHSGALEAFGYDSLAEKGKQDNYDMVIGRFTSITIVASIFSTFMGGLLYRFDPKAPFYAWFVWMIASVVVLYFATEPKVNSRRHATVKSYLIHLKEGVVGLFNDKLRIFLPAIFTIVFLIKLYQGMVRQSIASYFGLDGETFGYVFALVTIPAVFVSFKFATLKKAWGEKRLLLINFSVFLLAFCIALFARSIGTGVAVFLCLVVAENIAQPLIASITNKTIESRHRATTLSTLALFSQVPYIILVFFFAHMVELENIHSLFGFFIAFIVIGLIYSALALKKNDITKVSITSN